MVKARIELKDSLSLTLRGQKFELHKPIVSTNAELIKACQETGGFVVNILSGDVEEETSSSTVAMKRRGRPAKAKEEPVQEVLMADSGELEKSADEVLI